MMGKYSAVKALGQKHGVSTVCRVLQVSKSAYYRWKAAKPGRRQLEDVAIRRAILLSHAAAPCYGLDNIHADVRETLVCGRNRVRRLMRQMGVKSQRKRRYKATTNSAHKLPAAPNRVKGHPPKAPDKVWVCDITYIHTDAGFLYLATVKDLFTREIVGFASSARIDAALTTAALCKAVEQRKPAKGLICHSDRGVQYCCHEYRSLLEGYGILASNSRKGNPYENAVAENFFSCLKCEMVYLQCFQTRHEAALELFRYIAFYNNRRRHSALGRIAPAKFHAAWRWEHGSVGAVCKTPDACAVKGDEAQPSLDGARDGRYPALPTGT